MMVYDVLFKRGENEGKGIWMKCGIVLQKPNGKMSLKLDTVPVGGDFDGWMVISERRPNNNEQDNVPEIPQGQDVPF
ncbi:MAG: hypothetical protein KJ804_12150 [Proteobacteria bacterium]|nr:hypothetical protein [Pseudomonadota bacterium]MBU1059055.1 hypothetical protein [Pseudomonadota bacterium]